ncbi:DNA-directed RNA polymerase subunit beta' [Striga asiatica]|uniref:DNA-directed RNA polymerase subunit beta n=1 Tax=Striga asiatica TaxID=4170 RepID=A0A5A7QIL6_STRAF|nr:DNA-directed RNA polymerase subunit beta' [Striga asiatica]
MGSTFELDEDDIFYKDLSKRISLLIMDDDHDNDAEPFVQYPSAILETFTQERQEATFFSYDNQEMEKKSESKGTGVFIPAPSAFRPRRNRRRGKPTRKSRVALES